ncbi:GCN5-related N-acetyltransferase (GNAT) domain-containing protein [Pochonia chlamydosporia 170]|uniref:GCN5-related N-acetyltransferase (GNAT) domain-containing protein n=1 Tax=Pochonia chlamydosporia 170 TaxID=1380566 RepID=A0A179G0G4_METCM|nr:GCN5-related N-acetyltransferase (GNAT) domain-containing protein [Pochonia chlamydosporia 170]OAQ71394.1 GCN5-related N-acetyltransferase (GNAT) domain-containing protein [Pochonia chlamydosporia 170]
MSFTPFILVTDRLVFVPTPISESIPGYRTLFKKLHEDHEFCGMGFGDAFPAKSWTDDQIRYELLGRDVKRWHARNMGDFAVGILPTKDGVFAGGRRLKKLPEVRIIELEGSDLSWQEVDWVGYSCARDCIPMLPPRGEGDAPLPPWQEMLEMRYGVSPEHWGKGIALEATRVVVQWAVEERGARRFIAETLKSNRRSGRVLEKLGFRIVDTDYFKERNVLDEWEMVVS